MQESVSMHKSPTPVRHSRMNQARSAEDEKERKRDRKDRGQEADGKKGSPTKKNTLEELTQGLPRHSSGKPFNAQKDIGVPFDRNFNSILRMDSQKNSYERPAYESVDEKSLS